MRMEAKNSYIKSAARISNFKNVSLLGIKSYLVLIYSPKHFSPLIGWNVVHVSCFSVVYIYNTGVA